MRDRALGVYRARCAGLRRNDTEFQTLNHPDVDPLKTIFDLTWGWALSRALKSFEARSPLSVAGAGASPLPSRGGLPGPAARVTPDPVSSSCI